jgi:hypothetical protein
VAVDAPPGARSRYGIANVALAVGVVLGIVVLLVVLLPRPHYDAVKPIDPTEAIRSAQRVAPYHVFVPTALPQAWRATSARVDGPDAHHVVHLHIGYVSPGGAYVALEESNEPAGPFIALETVKGKPLGQLLINGHTWDERFSANQSEYSLARTATDGVSIVVAGNSVTTHDPYAELAELVTSLR